MTKKLFIIILLLVSYELFPQANWHKYYILNEEKEIANVHFYNAESGYLITREVGYATSVYKTTNRGINWSCINSLSGITSIGTYPSVVFLNNNTGFIVAKGDNYSDIDYFYIYKTTNGGYNWNYILNEPLSVNHTGAIGFENIKTDLIFVDENTVYLNSGFDVYKSTNCCQSWNKIIEYSVNLQHKFSSFKFEKTYPNILYAGGQNYNSSRPVVKISSDAGNSWTTYTTNSSEVGPIFYMDIINGNLKYTGPVNEWYSNSVEEFSISNGFKYISLVDVGCHQTSFINENNAIIYAKQGEFNRRIIYSTDGGVNWDYDGEFALSSGEDLRYAAFPECGNIRYTYGWGGGHNYVIVRELNVNLFAKNNYTDENTSSANMQLNDHYYNTYNGSVPHNMNILGGNQTVTISSSSQNEIFYKWNSYSVNGDFHPLNISIDNYYVDKGDIIANFKTKFKSTTSTAISNSPQTKAIKDTILTSLPNGIIHEIHESMGGIFYSRSTDGGSNFSKEEVVNYNPNTNDADGNKNSFLNVLRQYGTYNPITQTDQNNNVTVTWERYNPNTQSTEIFVSRRHYESPSGSVYWQRYYNSQNNPVFKSFTASQDFNSYPKVFAIIKYDVYEDLNQSIIYVPHLEPYGTNQKKLVVSASAYSNGFITQNFELDNGNISDVSVTGIKAALGGYALYFAYIKDNSIIYRKEVFLYENGMSFSRTSNPEVTDISNGDGQLSRISLDISLRNGYPIITYRGQKYNLVPVKIDPDNIFYISLYDYPVIVKYKYPTTNGELWSSFTYFKSSGNTQENPNVEGNKTYPAYLLNFKFGSNMYKQFVFTDHIGNCSPRSFSGTDAKLVRGTFSGNSFPNSSPLLLTLTQSGSLYNIDKQPFTVSNPANPDPDMMSNLTGIIREQNMNYNFNLGPVIAKNCISTGFYAEGSIDNLVEFNSNLISAPFQLGPGDTLVLGGKGYYGFVQGESFTQKRFSAFLMRKSSQEPIQTLFSDSIGVLDTIESEYLRGFVFTEGQLPEADSFYVQMFIDSTSLYQGDQNYSICNVYSPDEVYGGGDNSHSYKRAIHFMNKGNPGNNISNIPKEYSLSQNYPNPFNPVTNIKYQLPKDGLVIIKVYDITGREIAKLVNEVKQAGNYTVSFNGSNFASGVYFYRIQSGDFVQVKKMVLIK